ncbi:MAG TPA: hypothetical protein PLC53_03880 [Bacilli bacterium]|nr:hypothetical protein [Bacilli bacterium]
MTYMFLVPLIGSIFYLLIKKKYINKFIYDIYNSGIATLTTGFLLKGIFDIAGTSSIFQVFYTVIGISMISIGIISYIINYYLHLKVET